MRTLGLSFDFHDSSAAIVENGQLLFSAAEERFTRQKHDSHFPYFSIQSALESTQLTLEDIDSVIFYEIPEYKFSRLLNSSLKTWPTGAKEFSTMMATWLGSKLWTKARISQKLRVHPQKLLSIPHHQSHAYQAFLGSGFEEAAILVMDAVGEWDSGSTYKAHWENGRPILTQISEMKYPHSLGLFYSAMTDFLGFKPMNDECTTMALAAFGTPTYYEALRELLLLTEEGTFHLPTSHFNFNRFYQKPYTSKFIELFEGPPRTEQNKLNISSFGTMPLSFDEQRWVNIAASVQKITEEILLRQAQNLLKKTQLKNLCFAGGVALNCVANTRLLLESGCEALFVPPEPGDGGAAIGAAFAGYYLKQGLGNAMIAKYSATLGPKGVTTDLNNLLPLLKPQSYQKYRQLQTPYHENLKWEWQEFSSINNLCAEVAQLIHDGKMVGWYQGSMELGPRALGQRSILIRPDDLELARRLSSEVKVRAPFRPYALSMTEDTAKLLLISPIEDLVSPKPPVELHSLFKQSVFHWMQLAFPVHKNFHENVRAGIHIDGTTRPQIVMDSSSPYYKLLTEFGKLSGYECLLNTSFNEKDYPIVGTDTEALSMFARTSMDVLVINNFIIKKSYTKMKSLGASHENH